ncbi:MAG: DNA polymerase I [Syntrophaceae bacterium]|nr:DNA polymerase I [Syntrophaceae bacterium]
MTEEKKRPKFILVDGNNYLFRAFYAIRELSNSKGFPTNAIYGFTTMLTKLLREQQPNYIAVTFDVKGPTFRHDAFEEYKATRRATPDALIPQIPYIKDIVRCFGIPVLEQQGIEADDIIGTLAKRYAGPEMEVVIVSGDKDMMQLVSEHVFMTDTMKDKIYDRKAVEERFGVQPEQVVEILGLMGDTSDNIPGVPGIGPKGAQRLIEQFGNLEAILANPEKVYNARTREAIMQNASQARLSRELARIRTDAEFPFDLEACRLQAPDKERLIPLYREFEFSSLLQELKIREEEEAHDYRICRSKEDLKALVERLALGPAIALEPIISSPEAMRTELVGLALSSVAGQAVYIPLAHEDDAPPLDAASVLKALAPLLADPAIPKQGHDLKTTLIVLAEGGVTLQGLGCDTMVAAYLLNPARHSFELADTVLDHLGRQVPAAREVVGSGARSIPFAEISVDKAVDYACRRAEAILALAHDLERKLAAAGLDSLFHDVEMPLVEVLAAMERRGVLLDTALLKNMSQEIAQLLALSEEKIYRMAGERFNINSPKQLQVILFDKLGLPRGKKTKGGYSTDVDVLSALAVSHELPAEILGHRGMAKLKSTYVDALPGLILSRTGRVHTSYNQTIAATGRLSSSNPNLQNIPIRTPEGRRIRQAFVAPEGWLILSADYSQIELRILAHLSGDSTLIAAFTHDEDIHSRTASDLFDVFPEMVNADMRRQAKVINFGVLYGMSAFGLSRELGITQKRAQAYIDGYFQKYAQVREYLNGVLSQARNEGYVTTMLNRRRYLPEISNSQPALRQFAERMAINAPIQGTAADLIKVAMVRIARRLAAEKCEGLMIMQVHDELVFELPAAELEALTALVRQEMEESIKLRVPLKVEIAFGKNWDEAHT